MGILGGAMTVRRFRVRGDIPEGFRDVYREQLDAYAFREPTTKQGKEEIEGWVQVHSLLDTEFSDFNRWFYDPYVLIALRVDKKTLPAKLFNATVKKRCEAWCAENGLERCPRAQKDQIKEQLEDEWLDRALPRVAMTEACWNVNQGFLVLHSLSEKVADRFRKRFHQTFGLELLPWSPLDWLDDAEEIERLLASSPTALVEEATP